MVPAISGATAAALYLFVAVWHWRQLTQPHAGPAHPGPGADSAPISGRGRVGSLLLLGALAVVGHALAAANLLYNPAGADFGLLSMAVVIAWVIALFTVIASVRLPIANLLLIIFPLAAFTLLAALLSGRLQNVPDPRDQAHLITLSSTLLSHILISIAAYSILSMAAGQSILLAIQERQLKNRQTKSLTRLLPPMETMERLLFLLLWVGLSTLTIAIASGFAFLDDMLAQNMSHHTVLACLAWLVFATLLYGHRILGWRGSTAVRWTLAGFILLLLAYFGSKFVAEILLGR